MRFLDIFVLVLYGLSPGFSADGAITVQVQQKGVVSVQQIVEQVLLNGVSLTGTSQEADNIIQTISADAHLPSLVPVNQTSGLRNHAVLRSRDCILRGSQLHWTDTVFYDGTVYLTLDHTDTWTAHVPQALALKVLWDQRVERTRMERMRLHEGCIKLMRELSLSVEQSDIVVQIQQRGVVSVEQVVDQVLCNGVVVTNTSQEVDDIIQKMSVDSPCPTLIDVNHTSVPRNHIILRSRECLLEESQLRWTDRVFYDGTVYLTLDHTDTVTAHVPQALALKMLWDQEVQRIRTEKIPIQEGCVKLMKELQPSVEQPAKSTPLLRFLIPFFAVVVFIIMIITSFLLYKKWGVRHPGGVVGSIVHCPKNKAN